MPLLGRILAPIVAEIVVKLISKYVDDAAFRAGIDRAVFNAKKLAENPDRTEAEVTEAALALTKAINS